MGKRHKKRANIRGWEEKPIHSKSQNLNQYASQVEEEVIRVGRIPQVEKRGRFQQLSKVSLSSMIDSPLVEKEEGSESGEEVGFFLDCEPAEIPDLPKITQLPEIPKLADIAAVHSKQYEKQYKRIIQDDSVYIDKDDDLSSISSSEDLEGLEALSHWAKQDIMSVDNSSVDKEIADYDILEQTTFDDILGSSEEEKEEEEEEEEEAIDESFLNENVLSQYVPEFMRNSYKSLVRKETKRLVALQNKKPRQVQIETIKNDKRLKSSVLEKILREFITKEDVSSYSFSNLTNHGRVNVIPKLAQLFNLELSLIGGNPKNILLKKTKNTSIPTSFKKHRAHQKRISKPTTINSKKRKRNDTFYKDEKEVGGIVGGTATPISSSNVGHRMLAAMGWKQGEAIGSNENGIKEPIQVTIRPKNRGLGA